MSNKRANRKTVVAVDRGHEVMVFQLLQKTCCTSSILEVAAWLTQVGVELSHHVVYSHLSKAGAYPAFHLKRDQVLS
ncbi:hypothetical protein D3C85_1559540 [compost metagenome]